MLDSSTGNTVSRSFLLNITPFSSSWSALSRTLLILTSTDSYQHICTFEQFYLLLDIFKLISFMSLAIHSLTDFCGVLHLITFFCQTHCAIQIVESPIALLCTTELYIFFMSVEPNFMIVPSIRLCSFCHLEIEHSDLHLMKSSVMHQT